MICVSISAFGSEPIRCWGPPHVSVDQFIKCCRTKTSILFETPINASKTFILSKLPQIYQPFISSVSFEHKYKTLTRDNIRMDAPIDSIEENDILIVNIDLILHAYVLRKNETTCVMDGHEFSLSDSPSHLTSTEYNELIATPLGERIQVMRQVFDGNLYYGDNKPIISLLENTFTHDVTRVFLLNCRVDDDYELLPSLKKTQFDAFIGTYNVKLHAAKISINQYLFSNPIICAYEDLHTVIGKIPADYKPPSPLIVISSLTRQPITSELDFFRASSIELQTSAYVICKTDINIYDALILGSILDWMLIRRRVFPSRPTFFNILCENSYFGHALVRECLQIQIRNSIRPLDVQIKQIILKFNDCEYIKEIIKCIKRQAGISILDDINEIIRKIHTHLGLSIYTIDSEYEDHRRRDTHNIAVLLENTAENQFTVKIPFTTDDIPQIFRTVHLYSPAAASSSASSSAAAVSSSDDHLPPSSVGSQAF